MQKYGIEVGVDCGLSSNVTHNWITDVDKDIAFN